MDDCEAVARLKQGDIGGLEGLVRKYQLQALRAADLILQDRQQAEDIVQAAFLRAYQRIHQFEDGRPFGPWFLRSVVNEALKAATRNKRKVSLDQEAEAELVARFERLVERETVPETEVERREMRQAVQEAIAALSPEQRAVIVLHDYLGLTLEEVSTQTGSPQGTLKWRLHVARERLRTLLKPARDGL